MGKMKDRLRAFQKEMRILCKQELTDDEALIDYYNANAEKKNELVALAKFYLNNELAGCGSCYVDATAQLLSIDLKSPKANKKEVSFALFAGAILQDCENFDSSKSVSNWNLTDEWAWFYLNQNPQNIKQFQKLPEDFDLLASGKIGQVKIAEQSENGVVITSELTPGKVKVKEKGFYLNEQGKEDEKERFTCEGDFSLTLKELTEHKTYCVKAYAYNGLKEIVSQEQTFVCSALEKTATNEGEKKE